MVTRESLARRISEERQRAGLTQKELSERLGIDRTTLTRIEGGHQGVDTLLLSAIAEALARPPAVFFEPAPAAPEGLRLRAGAADDGKVRKHVEWLEAFIRDYQFLQKLSRG